MIFYGYVKDVEKDSAVKHRIEAVCATVAYGMLEDLRMHHGERLVLADERGMFICESDVGEDVGWLLHRYDREHCVSLDDRLEKAMAQSEKDAVLKMREFLKEHDPQVATDEYLDDLSVEELTEYFWKCLEEVRKNEAMEQIERAKEPF